MDDRLAELKDEIDRILSTGPIGRWSNPPPAFPFLSETVVFNADGSGEITSWSAMSGKTVQSFSWNMDGRSRLVVRYGLTRYAAHLDEEPKEEEDAVELSPITHEIEIRVQETHLGPWPVMITDGRDTFDWLWTALSRDEPPLRLQPAQPLPQPPRSLLSRMRNFVPWSRSNRDATAQVARGQPRRY